MWIHGTKKLRDRLKDQPETRMEQSVSNDLFSWHANLVRLNRRQSVVLMHDSSEYPIILYGLRAKDLTRLHETLEQAIRLVWGKEGIKESVIEDYIAEDSQPGFAKTKNPSLVTKLNKVCQEAHFFEDYIDEDRIIQTDLSFKLARRIKGVANKTYLQPIEMLYPQLQLFAGGGDEDIISVRGVELDVQ